MADLRRRLHAFAPRFGPSMIPQSFAQSDGVLAPSKNREQWLTEVAVALRPWFAARGYDIPLRVRLGVGALAATHRTLGICHCGGDRDGFKHITISPFIDDPLLVAAVLTHELIHATLPPAEGHGQAFAKAARALGFEGRLTQVSPGRALQQALADIVKQVGPYPHKALLA